jgi:hypothetical protein
MSDSLNLRAAAFAVAAIATLGLFRTIDSLAVREQVAWAVSTAPVQQVVIVAPRLPRG